MIKKCDDCKKQYDDLVKFTPVITYSSSYKSCECGKQSCFDDTFSGTHGLKHQLSKHKVRRGPYKISIKADDKVIYEELLHGNEPYEKSTSGIYRGQRLEEDFFDEYKLEYLLNPDYTDKPEYIHSNGLYKNLDNCECEDCEQND